MSWYSVEPFLSLSAGFAFPDIVVILGRSYLRRVDSRVTISAEYMLDLLCVPMELSLGYQDRSDIFDAILGYISLIQQWRRSFSHRSSTVSIPQPRYIVLALLIAIPVILVEMSFKRSTMLGFWSSMARTIQWIIMLRSQCVSY